MTNKVTYADAGVDVEAGDAFVERIKQKVAKTYGAHAVNIKGGVGGFAALYESQGRYLVAGTDGVGTKVKLAQILGKHDTIGIDLVAMCVNDVLCTGARGLFFLDYMAYGKLNIPRAEAIIDGIVKGCIEAGYALIGGETAEMPGVYSVDDYDLAGFAVGEVDKDKVLNGERIQPEDRLIGLASSGFHSNGYSLVRKLVEEKDTELLKECLAPTRIYVKLIERIQKEFPGAIVGLAHITGGGFHNIPRMSERFDYKIETLPALSEIAPVFGKVLKNSQLSVEELYQTFNMGVGMTLAVKQSQSEELKRALKSWGELCFDLGKVVAGSGKLLLP